MYTKYYFFVLLLLATVSSGFSTDKSGLLAAEEDLNIYRKEGLKHYLHTDSIPEDLFNDPNEIGQDSLITLRAIDHEGKPVPYCRIVFVDRDDGKTGRFYETATNKEGFAYCNIHDESFSINTHLYEYNPVTKESRSQHKKVGEIYNVHDNKLVTVQYDPFPTGSGKVEGQISDQHGKPLTKFELTLNYLQGVRTDWSESYSTYQRIEVNDPQGHFEFEGLLPRTYSYMIYPEDVTAYNWDFDMGNFTIPKEPNAVAQLDIEVEAKELRYGQAFYNDGMPVYPGSFQLWFKKYSPEERLKYHTFGEGHRNRIQSNGFFRIPLSQQEKRDFMITSQGYVIIDDEESIEIGQVHIDKLSETSDDAPRLIFPRKSPRSTLVSSLLPDMKNIKIDFNQNLVKGKMVLVCFWDINQRPSRNCIMQLSKRAQELKTQGVEVVVVQASKIEQEKLDEWIKENNIPFAIGMIEENEEQSRFNWGVKSLPWLILTDKQHTIQAEGLSLEELAKKLKQINGD